MTRGSSRARYRHASSTGTTTVGIDPRAAVDAGEHAGGTRRALSPHRPDRSLPMGSETGPTEVAGPVACSSAVCGRLSASLAVVSSVDYAERVGFTYAVLSQGQYVGCVYLYVRTEPNSTGPCTRPSRPGSTPHGPGPPLPTRSADPVKGTGQDVGQPRRDREDACFGRNPISCGADPGTGGATSDLPHGYDTTLRGVVLPAGFGTAPPVLFTTLLIVPTSPSETVRMLCSFTPALFGTSKL